MRRRDNTETIADNTAESLVCFGFGRLRIVQVSSWRGGSSSRGDPSFGLHDVSKE